MNDFESKLHFLSSLKGELCAVEYLTVAIIDVNPVSIETYRYT
jgi:hypothetical protein